MPESNQMQMSVSLKLIYWDLTTLVANSLKNYS